MRNDPPPVDGLQSLPGASCLIGCPCGGSFTKDAKTGVVSPQCRYLHQAASIALGIASYECRKYNAEPGSPSARCDIPYRPDDGCLPLAFSVPEGAIAIEIVNVAEWRRDYLSRTRRGLPSAATASPLRG